MGFKILEGDICIINTNGIYQQCDLYTLDGSLFAKVGSGFIRLKADGSTSKARSMLNSIECEVDLYKDKFGRLSITNKDGYKPVSISPTPEGTLLIEG